MMRTIAQLIAAFFERLYILVDEDGDALFTRDNPGRGR